MGRRAVIFRWANGCVFRQTKILTRSREKQEQKTMWLQRDQKVETAWTRGVCDPVSFLHHTPRTVPQLSIIERLSTWVAWVGSVSYNHRVQTRVQVYNPHRVRFHYCTTPAQGLGVPFMGTNLPLLWDHRQLTLRHYGRPFSCCGHTWCVQSLVMSLNLQWSHLRRFNLISAEPFLLPWEQGAGKRSSMWIKGMKCLQLKQNQTVGLWTGWMTYFILWWPRLHKEARAAPFPTRWVWHQRHRWQPQRCMSDRALPDPDRTQNTVLFCFQYRNSTFVQERRRELGEGRVNLLK